MIDFHDQVVYEADVFFAPKRKGDLHLFQFSHNSSPLSVKKSYLGPIKAKPKCNQFEIELILNLKPDTFDKDKSKKIAFMVNNNQNADEEKCFINNSMNRQILSSEQLSSTGLQFALCYLRNDLKELQLIPIKSVLEFKPFFKYLDNIKTNSKNNDDSEESSEDEQMDTGKNNQPKKITMRFEDNKNSNDKNKNEKIKEIHENWLDVKYFDYGAPKFDKEKDIVLYKINQEDVIDENFDNMKIFSYKEFCNKNEESASESIINEENTFYSNISFCQIRNFKLRDQVRIILCNSKVISFNKCINCLNELNSIKETDIDTVLKFLQVFGHLVQGNWVVKSDLIYPKNLNKNNDTIPFTNISVEFLCKARDFILYKFTKHKSLNRLELLEQVKVPAETITEILNQFSIFNKETRFWDFAYMEDKEFLMKYKEIANRQEMLWEAQSGQLINLFS